MAYTTDLAIIHACDGSTTSWTEPAAFADGAITLPEGDYFIQNTGCLSKTMGNATTAVSGAIYNNGTGITITAPNAVFVWIYFGAPNALATQTNGGLRFLAGSSTTAYKQYYIKGSNTYIYGGWLCIPFHPSIETGAATISVNATNGTFTRSAGDFTINGFEAGMTIMTTGFTNAGNNTTKIISTVSTTVITVTSLTGLVTETGGGDEWVRQCDNLTGSPTTTAQYFGAAAVLSGATSVSKGNPLGMDAYRYGRGEARVNGTADFAGLATENDLVANRWGLFQAIDGGYLWQGLMVLGYSSAVTFTDSNKNIFVANNEKVVSSFNTIEVRQAGSTVSWTGISISALITNAVSRGNFVATDNATITIDTCTFADMGTFIFQSNSTISDTTFRRCNLVTQGSANFDGCTFDKTNDSVKAMLSNNPQLISNCSFISSGTKHAIEANTANGATYYSNGTVTDPQGVWTNDGNAYDGSTATSATTSTAGSTSTNYLQSTGTNAPASGSTITEVRIRIYGSVASGDTLKATVATDGWTDVLGTASLTSTSAGWSSFAALSTPPGGWDWTKAQALDTRIYKEGTAGTANAYRVDIAVFTSSYTFTGNTFTGYASTDGISGNEAFYNNSGGPIILYVSGGTPTVRDGTNASTVVVSSVVVTVHVQDVDENPIQYARVYATRNSDSSIIINGLQTDSSGDITGSTVSGAGGITIRVRRSSTGTTRYYPVEASGTVGEGNVTVNVTLTPDIVAST